MSAVKRVHTAPTYRADRLNAVSPTLPGIAASSRLQETDMLALNYHGSHDVRVETVPDPEVSPHFFLRDQALVASRRGRRCAHGARFKVTKPEKSANHARQRSIAEVPV
ncbi:hypothetical protein EYC54_03390 [Xanthomonas oryzae]|nr:hypothetical protein EYC54_03390 [Xanthomonas oryzae]